MENLQACKGTMWNMAPSETLAIAAKAKALIAQGQDVCSMTAGEPDFDTPEYIKEAAIKALKEGKTKYTPAAGIPELRKAIAEKLVSENKIQTTVDQVVVGPGAKYVIFEAIAALCGPGDEVIIPSPYWVSYPEMVKAAGAVVKTLPCKAENNYELVPEELEKAVTPNTKLLILNSPSNPTGAIYKKRTLEKIAEIAVRKNFMVMSDEIYSKLVYDAGLPHVSIASFSKEIADLTITIDGFSKAYSMTGWRLGYLSAPLWLAKRVTALQSHTVTNTATFAMYGALAALTQKSDAVETMRKAFEKRRDLIHSLVSDIPGIKCVKPSGAFYLFFDASSYGLKSAEFCDRLLNDFKVAAIPGAPFGAEGHVRFSYACSEETIKKAVSRLAEFCKSL